ncbi:MAG: tRNA (cytidine(34)-2'-O)-methyltransferase [Acidimicrobiia bacterium]
MFDIVLYEPEIPPNTGNIMRLCANTGATLHLIGPLGFTLDERQLRRAGLDYREWADVRQYKSVAAYLEERSPPALYAFSRNGTSDYSELFYEPGDALIFGPESDGLPADVLQLEAVTATVRVPMVGKSRSLNLANAVAVALYEALRQQGFPGLRKGGS